MNRENKQRRVQINRNPQKGENKTTTFPGPLLLLLLLPLRQLKEVLTAETAYNTDLHQPERESLLCSAFLSYVLFSTLCSFVMARILHWAARFGANCLRYNHARGNASHTHTHIETCQETHSKQRRDLDNCFIQKREEKAKNKRAKKINGQTGVLSHFKGQCTAVRITGI